MCMKGLETAKKIGILSAALTILVTLCSLPAQAGSEQKTSAELLLPYFQVDLLTGNLTTLFSIVNVSDEDVPIQIEVVSNWGVPVLEVPLTLAPKEVRPFNLMTWLRDGALPDETLAAPDLAHLRAALTGELSPKTSLYYSAEMEPGLAVGYLSIRALGLRPSVLFGNYFTVDPGQDFAKGESLVAFDSRRECQQICRRHRLRYLLGGAFDGGTELVVWTARRNEPSAAPELQPFLDAEVVAYAEDGTWLDSWSLGLRAAEKLDLAALVPPEPFGWFEVTTSEDSFLAVRYDADDRYSVGLEGWCLELPAQQ